MSEQPNNNLDIPGEADQADVNTTGEAVAQGLDDTTDEGGDTGTDDDATSVNGQA